MNKLHAHIPGEGPKGETCGSCFHIAVYKKQGARATMHFCEQAHRLQPANNFKIKGFVATFDPACKYWEPAT